MKPLGVGVGGRGGVGASGGASVGEEGEDCRGVSAEGDRACHVDAEAAEEEDELPAARLRGMEVEAGLGRLAKRAGLAVLGGDPAVLEDVAEDRRGIEGEASEGRFASAVAESGISGEVGGRGGCVGRRACFSRVEARIKEPLLLAARTLKRRLFLTSQPRRSAPHPSCSRRLRSRSRCRSHFEEPPAP